jgi:hypothetical protein
MATVYIGAVDPNTPGHYPICPLKAFTGLDCPGCGGLRAVHSLAHGDVVGALNHNVLAVVMYIPAIAIGWVLWVRREWNEPDAPTGPEAVADDAANTDARTRQLWMAALVVMLLFTVARNIPGVPAFEWLNSAS